MIFIAAFILQNFNLVAQSFVVVLLFLTLNLYAYSVDKSFQYCVKH